MVIEAGLTLGHRSRNLLPNNALKLTKPAKARMARSSQRGVRRTSNRSLRGLNRIIIACDPHPTA
jgi:hypothetical protein